MILLCTLALQDQLETPVIQWYPVVPFRGAYRWGKSLNSTEPMVTPTVAKALRHLLNTNQLSNITDRREAVSTVHSISYSKWALFKRKCTTKGIGCRLGLTTALLKDRQLMGPESYNPELWSCSWIQWHRSTVHLKINTFLSRYQVIESRAIGILFRFPICGTASIFGL